MSLNKNHKFSCLDMYILLPVRIFALCDIALLSHPNLGPLASSLPVPSASMTQPIARNTLRRRREVCHCAYGSRPFLCVSDTL